MGTNTSNKILMLCQGSEEEEWEAVITSIKIIIISRPCTNKCNTINRWE